MRSAVSAIVAGASAFVVIAANATAMPVGVHASNAGVPACIAVRPESRYVPYGYNHVVVLTSGCGRDATCSVATDVKPMPIVVDVRAGATVEVLTFMSSPASSFVARVACVLH
jgi:hypothetical protein